MDPRLGRIAAPDARDHSLRAFMAPKPAPASKVWVAGPVLDQGQTSECVANAWTGWELATPIADSLKSVDTPHDLYTACQKIDEWAGTPHDGTSVRAGAKVMLSEGRLRQYAFDTTVDVAKQWVLTEGPLVFGTNWFESMFNTNRGGVVHIDGAIAGGHAYLVYGYSSYMKAFLCRNSWGRNWGASGSFWLRDADAARLLSEDGEACAALEISR